MDAEDLLFILYTSGTTGKPKGIVHTTGGYLTQVAATTRYVFDLKPDGRLLVHRRRRLGDGPLIRRLRPARQRRHRADVRGRARTGPTRDRFWALIERYGVTVLYTAPTAIRAFMKWGIEHPARHDLSTLRLLGSVGEPINPEAWIWYHTHIGGGRCPIVDTWWQTETGGIMITPAARRHDHQARVGHGGLPRGRRGAGGQQWEGARSRAAAFSRSRPRGRGCCARSIGDDQRYQDTYWSRFPGRYFAGDGAKLDEDGYWWMLGRVDDVLNVAGHRIGTMEVESALVEHPAVAEAAVVGRAHELKGQALAAFVTLKDGHKATPGLKDDLKAHVVEKIGAIARPDDIFFSADLPKTRSGKIMRRLLKDIAEGRALGDTTTLADPAVVRQAQGHVRITRSVGAWVGARSQPERTESP